MKFPSRWKFGELKQRLVLTPEEKRVIIFIFAAFVLGLAVKAYRDAHPQPIAPPSKKTYRSRLYSPSPTPTSTVLFKFTAFPFLPCVHVCARHLFCGSFRREGTR